MGQLAGGVAHDFNNLLTVIAGNAELARKAATLPAIQERMAEILRASDRAGDLVRHLLAFSRADTIEPRVVDLNRTVGGVQRMLKRLLEENIEVLTHLASAETPVLVDPGQLEQVLLNLAVNARDAMPRGGRLTITSSAGPGSVTLSVADTGAGMDELTRERIFDPFFTTKPPGYGTGLGLSTVYGIVRKAGGDIAVDTAPGRGTTFTIVLPRADAVAAPASRSQGGSRAPRPGHGERVLVAGETSRCRSRSPPSSSRAPATASVTAANAPRGALDALDAHPDFDVVVSDLVMPGLTGTGTGRPVARPRPLGYARRLHVRLPRRACSTRRRARRSHDPSSPSRSRARRSRAPCGS